MTVIVRTVIEDLEGVSDYKPRIKYILMNAEPAPVSEEVEMTSIEDEGESHTVAKRQRKQDTPCKKISGKKIKFLQRQDTEPLENPSDLGEVSQQDTPSKKISGKKIKLLQRQDAMSLENLADLGEASQFFPAN
jgi:hypothetical protein